MKHKTLIIRMVLCLFVLELSARVLLPTRETMDAETRASFNVDWMDDYWRSADYHSKNLNIEHGERRTVGQPDNAPHTIWVFGNSVTFGYHVADGDTIASRLQTIAAPTFRVVNRSTIAQPFRGSYAWLRHTDLRPGDVVFITGAGNSSFLKLSRQSSWPECDKPAGARAVVTFFLIACRFVPPLPQDAIAEAWQRNDDAGMLAEIRALCYQRGVTFIRWEDLRFTIPQSDYIDEWQHLNGHGAAIVARALFDTIMVF